MDTQNHNDEKLSDEDEQIFNNQFKNLDFNEQIEKNETEMKQKFNKLSKYQDTQSSSTPVIDIENAILLVDEMTDLLQINCDMAKSYFYETHEDFNNNFGNQKKELVTMEYDQFKKILITALEEQQKYEKNNNNNNQDKNSQNSQNSLQLSQNKIQNDDQNDTQDQFQNNQQNTQDRFLQQEQSSKPQAQVHYYDDPNTNIYTKHNNMIFGNFIHNFNKDIYQYFSDFSKESPNGEPQVKAQDIPLIMRVAFYIDNITFHKTKEDKEEFFNQQDSYKIVLSQIDRYLQSQQKIDVDSLDITQYKFQFNQFLDFLEYFLQNESDIFLKKNDESNNEYQQQNEYNENSSLIGANNNNQSELEKQIKVNIQNYEEMLQNCNSEQERLVINNMLDSLYEQLNKLQIVKQPVEQSLIKKQKQLSKEEIRKKNMNEIFLFYCRQQYTQAPKYSFDRILYECHTMNLSNFLLFAKQFKINNYCLKLTKKMLPQIFKKVSNNYKDLTFQEFQIILEKIALLMFEDKDEELPNEFDKIEAFYKYIGVDDANFYRKHMHILNPPFNIQDPIGFRHLPKDRDRNIEIKKIPGKLAAELDKRKKERQMLVKKFISMTPKQSLQEQQYSSKLPTYEQNQSRFKQNSISQDSSYKMNIQQKKGNYSEKNQLKQYEK
ncbi:hypothetical protein PPERSA_04760 [Pseudocohnilembus persalinus]|uniref:Uncharacterized protein n=1 Tax=Pseudocohnilembus persalinus TaxID=266149 RepID=A0A0V0QP78_PSEPJ|nr:hypothetical protein PPERSA_04760 [Pseudocohnilembus persalinus]|eukprot:KRX03882.1 hypothetical protein PPERSA_04760 [Pseudocohnilembus persalinus]